MSAFIQKIKSLLKVLRIKPVSYVRIGMRPTRDWHIILSVVVGTLFILAYFAYYLYIQADQGKLFTSAESDMSKKTVIDELLLKKVVGDINNREKQSKEFIKNVLIPDDPSI